MKLNINKDQLIRNKFWLILLLAAPLILGGLFLLLSPVSAEIETEKKKADQVLKSAQTAVKPPFYNKKNIDDKMAEADKVRKQEFNLWEKLYKAQAGEMFWPALIEKNYPITDGKFLRELKYLGGDVAPQTDDGNHFTGKLISVENAYLNVQGKDGKTVKFYRVGPADMKLDGNRGYFSLQTGKDVQIVYQTGWYFNDKLTDVQKTEYTDSYATQIRPILNLVEPVDEEGNGVVLLRDWLAPKSNELPPRGVKFLRFVTPPWKADADISEEAWMAQEDLWIQNEIYRLIRQANDYVGKMDGKGATAFNQTATYKNPYFELKLKLLSANKLEVSIKNLQNYRQKLDVKFRARFVKDKNFEPEKFTIEGEPLDPKGTKDNRDNPKDVLTKVIDLPSGPPRTMIDDVEQALTWETAAVRRIDDIVIGSGSEIALNHRSFPDGVKPFGPEPKKEQPAAPDGALQGGAPLHRMPPAFIGDGGLMKIADAGPNGLIKNRYCEETTEQTRRLPVAVALIVDQDHIDRVLTSFGNSKFRFLLNQVLVNRYPLSVRPNLVGNEKLGPNGQPLPKGFPGQLPPRFGLPGLPGLPPAMAAGGDDEMESNVELVIYGTVTLYQRYPPRSFLKTAEAAPK